MNREKFELEDPIEKKSFLKVSTKTKDAIILCLFACILTFAAWQAFNDSDKQTHQAALSHTESEKKMAQILSLIDGVGEVEVMIGENENCVSGVVVVCEGANDFRVIMNIREAVCAALGTDVKDVKIYLKN